MSMTFEEFRRANVLRSIETFGRDMSPENMIPFALGMAEEAGEACGAVRGFAGITKRKAGIMTEVEVGAEVADTFFYGDLVVACAGLLTEDALQAKYNKVSERSGSPYRLIDGLLHRLNDTGELVRVV